MLRASTYIFALAFGICVYPLNGILTSSVHCQSLSNVSLTVGCLLNSDLLLCLQSIVKTISCGFCC